MGTDIAVGLLERSGQLAQSATDDARAALVKKLLLALVRRSSDAVATVRSKALGGVSTALQFLARGVDRTELLRRILIVRLDPQYADVAGIFRVAAVDEKATVRRAALSLVDATVPLLQSTLQLAQKEVASFFRCWTSCWPLR
jgi:hypothetical protein